LPSALVAFGTRRFGSGWCEKPAQSTADHPTTDPTDGPDDYQEFLYKIWVIKTVKTPGGRVALGTKGNQHWIYRTYNDEGAEFDATALAGKRSFRFRSIYKLLFAD
jgi:hypothetical protein